MARRRSPDPARAPMPMRKDALANREALLDAASVVFAREGYRRASVREICARAGVNVGAITRHFGGKEAIYREVIVRSGRSLVEKERCPRLEDFPSPADALRGWMGFHLRLVLIRKPADPIAGPMFMREFMEPTDAMSDLARLIIAPVRSELVRIVAALLGEGAPRATIESATTFIHGVCVFQAIGAPLLARIGRPSPANERGIAHLLDTLHPFALGGIRALKRSSPREHEG